MHGRCIGGHGNRLLLRRTGRRDAAAQSTTNRAGRIHLTAQSRWMPEQGPWPAGPAGSRSISSVRAMKLTDGNSAVSPASMAIAMAMVANGDSGESRDDVLRLLGFNPSGATYHS